MFGGFTPAGLIQKKERREMNTKEKIAVMQAWLDGKTIQLLTLAKHAWTDVSREPRWDWSECSYRIKPKEKTSIPATQEELKDIESVIFLKDKKDKDIYSFMSSEVKTMGFKDKTVWYKFNPHTKCWEDWREE